MTNNKLYNFIFISVILVNLTGVFNGIFIADSALYAAISKLFVTSGNWLEIFVDGNEWLDKPHFPFWMSAISMKLFGVNEFGYKLPSFFFFLLSLYYTYKFASRIYSKEVALLSLLILSSALHIIVSNNDVRAEATMLGLIMGSTYHFYKLSYQYSLRDMLLGAALGAAAIMTKGIFILIPVGCAILGDIIFKKRWKDLFKWYWLVSLLLILIFIVPELWAVYYQFDMHPEKLVFGKTNVSGIKFFFWDSQFGRFFNTGPITGKGDPLFFFHTLLWAFAPWALIAYGAIFKNAKQILSKQTQKEYATIGGFLSMLVIFSLSKFQLPHYLNIIFPYLSIIVASYITQSIGRERRFFTISQIINLALLVPLSVGIYFYFRPGREVLFGVLIFLTLGLAFYIKRAEGNAQRRLIYFSILSSIYIGLFLNLVFYPKLLTYQSGTNAAKFVNEHYSESKVGSTFFSSLFEFYIDEELIRIKSSEQLDELEQESVIFTDKDFLKLLDLQNRKYTILETFNHFHITRLTPVFLNPATRNKTLQERYLIELTNENP